MRNPAIIKNVLKSNQKLYLNKGYGRINPVIVLTIGLVIISKSTCTDKYDIHRPGRQTSLKSWPKLNNPFCSSP